MWAVILTVLKIIGIILLSVLGLAILLLILILFVPIRYRIHFEKPENGGDISVRVNISYLLHIVSAYADYIDEVFNIYAKLFGIKIYDRNEKKRQEEETPANNKDENTAMEEGDGTKASGDRREEAKLEAKAETEPEKKTSAEPETKNTVKAEAKTEAKTGSGSEIKDKAEIKSESEAGSQAGNNRTDNKKTESSAAGQKGNDKKSEKEPAKGRMESFISFLLSLKDKACDFIENAEKRMEALIRTVEGIFDKISYYERLVTDPRNINAVKEGLYELNYLLGKLKPKKVRGYVHFGNDDPSVTGKILMWLSVSAPILPRKLEIIPDFEEEAFDADVYVKGRLCLYTLLVVLWKLYFNKDVRRLLAILKNR